MKLLGTLLVSAAMVFAQAGASLLVLSKAELTLSIIDPATLKCLAKMPSGPDPHEVSTDGKFAYISNYGGGLYNTITVVDLTARKTVETIDLGGMRAPHGLMMAGGKLWFTAESAKVVGSYDPASKKIDWVMGTGQNGTHMIWVTPDLRRVVTSNIGSGTMSFLDKTEVDTPRGKRVDWAHTVVPVGPRAEGFDVTSDGKLLWAANAGDGTISVIDMASKKVTATLQANVKGANRLKFTPDGKLALVSSLSQPDMTVFDVATQKEIKRIPIGKGAAGIEVQPDGKRAFIASTPDSWVTVIDLAKLEAAGRLGPEVVGKNPDGMAWAVGK